MAISPADLDEIAEFIDTHPDHENVSSWPDQIMEDFGYDEAEALEAWEAYLARKTNTTGFGY